MVRNYVTWDDLLADPSKLKIYILQHASDIDPCNNKDDREYFAEFDDLDILILMSEFPISCIIGSYEFPTKAEILEHYAEAIKLMERGFPAHLIPGPTKHRGSPTHE